MIGAIADDFTGGTDVAVAFRRAGLRAAVLFGLPDAQTRLDDVDAVVIALKTRTVPPEDAVSRSLAAARWLQERGAGQLYFKYCSTFDSTPEGNIGPVADALADLVGAGTVVMTPSSPEHKRTVYQGHLFVGPALLSDSPMRHHPLTPMTNSRIAEVLAAQTERTVESIRLDVVRGGSDRVAQAHAEAASRGVGYLVADALDEHELRTLGAALVEHPFVAGAAGLAGGLGHALAQRSGATADAAARDAVGAARSVALAGSCSARTLEQIAHMRDQQPSYQLDAVEVPDSELLAAQALSWYDQQRNGASPLIYSSLPPEQLRRSQEILGTERAAEILETAMGLIARGLVERGVRRLVVAGGETSGSVVSALGVPGGMIGYEAAPGVPWIYTVDDEPLALMLKSGNFGEPDLLSSAVLAGGTTKETR